MYANNQMPWMAKRKNTSADYHGSFLSNCSTWLQIPWGGRGGSGWGKLTSRTAKVSSFRWKLGGMHENPEDPSSPSSLIRWVLPDQPGSAPAFCSSHCNMALCLVSGSSLSSLRAHQGQMSYPVSGVMSIMCGGQSRDT